VRRGVRRTSGAQRQGTTVHGARPAHDGRTDSEQTWGCRDGHFCCLASLARSAAASWSASACRYHESSDGLTVRLRRSKRPGGRRAHRGHPYGTNLAPARSVPGAPGLRFSITEERFCPWTPWPPGTTRLSGNAVALVLKRHAARPGSTPEVAVLAWAGLNLGCCRLESRARHAENGPQHCVLRGTSRGSLFRESRRRVYCREGEAGRRQARSSVRGYWICRPDATVSGARPEAQYAAVLLGSWRPHHDDRHSARIPSPARCYVLLKNWPNCRHIMSESVVRRRVEPQYGYAFRHLGVLLCSSCTSCKNGVR